MRPTRCAALLLVSLALVAGAPSLLPGAARADDRPGERNGANGEVPGKTTAPAATSRSERAKKIVQELETTLTILRAARTADAESIRALERALDEAKSLARPLTLADLTAEERKEIAEAIRKESGEKDGPAAQNPLDDWRQRALASAFKDADLAEDEEIEATKIIQDWFQKSEAARLARDSKAMSDLKGERDKSLEKALGRKKAQKVINNLNALSGWKR